MDVDLTPRLSKRSYGGDGGEYYTWCSEELPMLRAASIGAGKLALGKRGMALPSYSDSAKVAYVLQGSGTCGIVLPEATKEKVIAIKKGDAVALPFGVVTWWFNPGDSAKVAYVLQGMSQARPCGPSTWL
ncbi:hypothetical protein OPV22_025908 [Ensete ventricosum]|uniref:Cupin type-1 domain-containing protein n=1 Tax=Ensete ventricosum TaxID=4639 RepID=A0AAV8QB54_ENSVE|nr:hypothetical protein OPV22_025908 [Ensete ventricosum]